MAAPRKSFKTEGGTELPLLSLKGKEYLQVAHRLVWFREVHPTGIIKTQMLAMQGEGKDEYAVFKTEVFVNGGLVSTAHKKETRGGFDDFIEKAETGSIGRALALAGFGTQFSADELDEKDRLADSPVEVIAKTGPAIVPDLTAGTTSKTDTGSNVPRSSFRKSVAAPVAAGDDI